MSRDVHTSEVTSTLYRISKKGAQIAQIAVEMDRVSSIKKPHPPLMHWQAALQMSRVAFQIQHSQVGATGWSKALQLTPFWYTAPQACVEVHVSMF